MPPNRYHHLRHPGGFDDVHFAAFRSGCEVWRAHVEAWLRHWRLTHGEDATPPRYDWYPPELSDDRRVATLPLGGQVAKELEDEFPEQLYQYLPAEFGLDLELGHSSPWHRLSWQPLYPAESRESLRAVLSPPKKAGTP